MAANTTFRIGRFPNAREVVLEPGLTLADALENAGLRIEDGQVRVNGRSGVELDYALQPGDMVLVVHRGKAA